MFCPHCGQQQIANEVRFCSRCGFPLNVVSEVLANGGQLNLRPVASEPHYGVRVFTPRQKGMRQGAMQMLSGLLVVPLVAVLTAGILGAGRPLIGVAALVCFVGGLLRIFYAMLFEADAVTTPHTQTQLAPQAYAPPPPPLMPPHMNTRERSTALPPAAYAFNQPPRRANTGELAKPPSVTENTTRLLDERRDPDSRS